jgi:hypothetical protein
VGAAWAETLPKRLTGVVRRRRVSARSKPVPPRRAQASRRHGRALAAVRTNAPLDASDVKCGRTVLDFPYLAAPLNAATLQGVIGLCDDAMNHAPCAAPSSRSNSPHRARVTRAGYVRPRARADENTRLGFRPRRARTHRGFRAAKERNRFEKIAVPVTSSRQAHPLVQEARQGNTYRQYPSDFLSDAPDPVPGTIDPAEPLADPYVRMEMRRALEESHPSGNLKDSKEQGGWIVKRAGGYRVIRWDDSTATYNSIDRPSGKPPKGTAAAFHTHRFDPGSASPQDWDIAQNDPFPNYIVGPHGVYRLTNMQQSFLGTLGGGGSGLFPWIVLGAGVAGGTAAYCHFHGC